MSQEWSADAGAEFPQQPQQTLIWKWEKKQGCLTSEKMLIWIKKHCRSLGGSELSNDKLETIVKTKALLCKLLKAPFKPLESR